MAGAIVLRVAIAMWPVLSHSDELWQYLEPARHIAAGRWVETWEFRHGLRSWFLPLLLSGPMSVGYFLQPFSRLDILLARLVCVSISVLGIIACIDIGRRVSRYHGLIAGIVTASWFELVYLGPRTAAEPVATAFALIAIALLLGGSPRRLVCAGLLIGLSFAVRIQYAPALAVLVFGAAKLDWRRYLHLGGGGIVGLAISGLADYSMGAVPFRWIGRSFSVNITLGKAATFGVEPFWWYETNACTLYGPAILVVVGLTILGSRRYPVLFASAVTNLAVHSCIAHKEQRFIFYTTSIFILLAAIGSVDAWNRYIRPIARIRRRWSAPAVLGILWVALSALCAGTGNAAAIWGVSGRMIAAWKTAGDVHDICGLGIYGITDMPSASYALLSRDVPIYQYEKAERRSAIGSKAFNVALAERKDGDRLSNFTLLSCDGLDMFCVYTRPGKCSETPEDRFHEENAFMIRRAI